MLIISFQGTSVDQDSRFGDKEQKYLKEMKFPACYAKKVNIKNVSMVYIKKWIAERLKKMLDVEDEILFNYVVSQLEEEVCAWPFYNLFFYFQFFLNRDFLPKVSFF